MNPSYRQTFSRHKVLFSLPVVITTLLAIWFVAGTPKQYKAGASLFVDTKSGQSSLDDTNPGNTWPSSRAQQLLTELLETIAAAATLVDRALASHLERHPTSADNGRPDDDVEAYAAMLVTAHRDAARRAEFLLGGYTSFLGGAIEAAGALAEAELTAARRRRWERFDPEHLVRQRAAQVYSALVNALGGLLAYARLTAEDRGSSGNF